METLEGQTVVVVGGTSGMGFGVAKGALYQRAARVLVASSTQARVDSAIQRLREEVGGKGLPGKIEGAVFDAKDMRAVETFIVNVGEIDHLVWTSGDKIRSGFKDVDLETFKDMFDVRFWGPAVAAQKVKIRPGGSITLTVGVALVRPVPTWSLLASVVGAVDSMTRGLAIDLAPVRVNVVSPGLVFTELWDAFPPETQAQYRAMGEKLLVKHAGTPDELAEAYLFLMKCKFITGQRIEVDGGQKFI